MRQRGTQHGPVGGDQPAVERVVFLGADVAADEPHHQHRHQRHRKPGGGGHRPGLGVGQRREQAALLRFEREHRQERERDDQQAEEQRRADFGGGIRDELRAGGGVGLGRLRIVAAPVFEVLVGVFDHDDRRIEHGADGDRDAAERHDVGVDALHPHDQECHQHADRQRQDGHQRRAQVHQEQRADDGDDDEFLDQLFFQRGDGALDQPGAVVDRHDLHARRQRGLERFQPRLDRLDGFERVLARAHDDHAAHRLAFAIEFGDAAAHLRPGLDARHIAEQHRRGAFATDRNGAEIVGGLEVAGGAHHVLGFAHLDGRTAGFRIGFLHRLDHGSQRQLVATQFVGIDHDLPGLDHAADGGDLGHVGHAAQFVLEKPVLQRAQLCEIHAAAAVDQRVLVDPADPGGIRPEFRPHAGRQAALRLVQVFEHARARPVEIGAVLEQHVHERIAEEREAAHRPGARHRHHGGGERVGDLVLDHARALSAVGGADDHLHVGEIGDGVDRRAQHGHHAGRADRQGGQQHQHAIGDRPAYEIRDHGRTSVPVRRRRGRARLRLEHGDD